MVSPISVIGNPRKRLLLAQFRQLSQYDALIARRPAPVIALLGLRGAGKSTIGPKLASRLSLRFVELDASIEKAAGLSLSEIFQIHGEGYYRRLERETLMALLSDIDGMVVATGG